MDYEREGNDMPNEEQAVVPDATVEIAIDVWQCAELLPTGVPTHQLGQGRRLTALLLALHHNDADAAKILLGHNNAYKCHLRSADGRREYDYLQDDHSARLYRKHVDHTGIGARDMNEKRESQGSRYRHRYDSILKRIGSSGIQSRGNRPPEVAEIEKESLTRFTSVLDGGCTATRLAAAKGLDVVVGLLIEVGKHEIDWCWLGSRDKYGQLLVNKNGQHVLHELCQAAPSYTFHAHGCSQAEQVHLLRYMRLLMGSTDEPMHTLCKHFVYPPALSELDKTLVWVEDHFRRLPLHYAAANGNHAMVELLLASMGGVTEPASSADEVILGISAVDEVGWAPLSLAVYHCHLECVRAILKAGACPLNSHLPHCPDDLRDRMKLQPLRYQELCMETDLVQNLTAVAEVGDNNDDSGTGETDEGNSRLQRSMTTVKMAAHYRLQKAAVRLKLFKRKVAPEAVGMYEDEKEVAEYENGGVLEKRSDEMSDEQLASYWSGRWELQKQNCDSASSRNAVIPSPYMLALVRRLASEADGEADGIGDAAPMNEGNGGCGCEGINSSMQRAQEEQADGAVEKVLDAVNQSPLVADYRHYFIIRYLLISVSAYFIYVGIITAVAFWNAYSGTPDVQWRIHNKVSGQLDVSLVDSTDTVAEFLTGPLAEFLYLESTSPNATNLFLGDGRYALVGSVRFRQLRAPARRCSNAPGVFDTYLPNILGSAAEVVCSAAGGDDYDTTAFITPDGLTHEHLLPSASEGMQWFRASTAEAPWKNFPKSGYVLDVPANLDHSAAVTEFSRIVEGEWTGAHTRALFVDFSIYSWDVDMLVAAHISFEYPSGGGVFSSSTVTPIHWPKWHDWAQSPTSLVLELCLYLFTVFNILIEIGQIWRSTSVFQYLLDGGNLGDISVLLLLIAYGCLRMMWWVQLPDRQATLVTPSVGSTTDYLDLQPLVWCHSTSVQVMAFGLIIAWLKLIRYMVLLPKVGPMIQASASAITSLEVNVYLGFFLLCVFVVALGCHIAFAYTNENYMNLSKSFLAVFGAFLDGAEVEDMQADGYWLGTVLALSITIFGAITLTNIFIAVVSDAYAAAVEAASATWGSAINHLLVKQLGQVAANTKQIRELESGANQVDSDQLESEPSFGEKTMTQLLGENKTAYATQGPRTRSLLLLRCLSPVLQLWARCLRLHRKAVFPGEVRYCHHPHKVENQNGDAFCYDSSLQSQLHLDVVACAMTDAETKQIQDAKQQELSRWNAVVRRQEDTDVAIHCISKAVQRQEDRLEQMATTLAEVARRSALV
jgi:hypothetical protein